MKKCLLVLVVLLLVAGSASASLVLHYEMNSADDYTVGDGTNGFDGRLYVDNKATGEIYAGMTSRGDMVFDPAEGAMRMEGVQQTKIQGMEDGNVLFTSATQYTFSLWAKGDKSAVSGNGYSFYLFFDDGSKFKCDLSFNPANAACFTAPGGSWLNNAYHIWDTDPAYADRYVDPETWNMYTFTWDVDNQKIATYINGIERATHTGGTAIGAGASVTDFGFGDGYSWAGPGGWYKDYGVWDNALDAAAVESVYLNGVPEPTTIALLGFGALALIRKRK